MKNDNSKLNTILLIIVIILLCILIFCCAKGHNWKLYSNESLISDTYKQPVPEDTTPVVKPVVKKPTATTLEETDIGGYGLCYSGGVPVPCDGSNPPHVTLNGRYADASATATTWFEYWIENNDGTKGNVQSTPRTKQKAPAGDVSYTLTNVGYFSHFRFVVQNSAGTVYGQTRPFYSPV